MTEERQLGSARRSIADAVEGTSVSVLSLREWGKLGLSAVISGSVFLWIAIALRSLSPGSVAFGRVCLGALTLALVPAAHGCIRQEDLTRFAFASFFGFAAPVLLLALAEERIPSAVAGMMTCTLPIATAVVAALETRSRPKRDRSIGLAVGLVGIALIAAPNLSLFRGEAIGVMLVLGSNVSVAISATLIAPLQQAYGSLRATMWLLIFSTGLLIPLGLAGLSGSTLDWSSLVALAFLGVVGTGVVWVLFVGLVGRVGAVRAGMAGYLIPVIALALGVIVLGENVGPVQLAGAVVALAGGYMVSRRPVTK